MVTTGPNASAYEPPTATCERRCCAAVNVLRRSIAIVIGPTPPGTGVMSPATSNTAGSTSPDELAFLGAIDAHVDHGRTRLDHLRRHEPLPADSGHEDVGAPRVAREIVGARVADRHGHVLGEEQHRHRLADDLAAADHHGLLALQLHAVLREHHHHARRRRGHQERLAEIEEPRVLHVEPVDVLRRIHGAQHRRLVHVLGQRQLHEDPVHCVVGVEVGDELEDLGLGRVGWEAMVARVDPGLVRGLVLRADVDVRRGIVTDQDRRQADGLPERADVLGDLRPHLEGELFPVDAHGRHRSRRLATRPMRRAATARDRCGEA